jgi:hypothetical protein
MKLLSDLLYKVRLEKVSGNTHLAISEIEFDSRKGKKILTGGIHAQ